VLSSPEPKPRPRAKDVAARALATLDEKHGRAAELLVPKEPYDLPPPILEAELASLQAAVGEVTLEGEIGRLTLVHAYSDAPRQELTFRDAAHLRTLVQIFPGARVVAITKPAVDHDAAEPPLDPLDLEADGFPPAADSSPQSNSPQSAPTDSSPQSNSPQSNSPQSNSPQSAPTDSSPQSNSPQSNSPQSADAEEDPFA
jgi:hypothetical protein